MDNKPCDFKNDPDESDSCKRPWSCEFKISQTNKSLEGLLWGVLIKAFNTFDDVLCDTCPCESENDREIMKEAEDKLHLAVCDYADQHKKRDCGW